MPTVIPFATSGGSSIKNGRSSESRQARLDGRVVTDEGEAKACDNLKAAYPDVNWKEGKLLNRASKQDLGLNGNRISLNICELYFLTKKVGQERGD